MSQISRLVSIAVLSLLALTAQATAESYPDRVVRIVNPYPPGGSVDVMARILAQKLSDNLGQ
jgi:tripartite-type tricarboxylate transporter receptor subunit TctC